MRFVVDMSPSSAVGVCECGWRVIAASRLEALHAAEAHAALQHSRADRQAVAARVAKACR